MHWVQKAAAFNVFSFNILACLPDMVRNSIFGQRQTWNPSAWGYKLEHHEVEYPM